MPITIDRPAPINPEGAPKRRLWTRAECEQLERLGFLNGRYELVEGEIISKMGQNPLHRYVAKEVLKWLEDVYGVEYVQGQAPVDVVEIDVQLNEPEPDAYVTVLPDSAFMDHHPKPNEVALLVEVADSSLDYDLTTKAFVYARSGFAEYWVVDVVGRRILVHRNPTPDGYGEIAAYAENEPLSPLNRPGAQLRASDILPPR